MFGKAKFSSHEKDEPLPPAPQLQDLTPANLAESNTTEISCIGPGVTVVGKISSEGVLNVLGRVEGELHASIVRISDGAQVEGTIAAQDLTIGGRFKGTIQADRVTLTNSAVVEGEIHHLPWQLKRTPGSPECRVRRKPRRAGPRIRNLPFSLCRRMEPVRSMVRSTRSVIPIRASFEQIRARTITTLTSAALFQPALMGEPRRQDSKTAGGL
jgi:cytoskeletal protein CcmA (bactofilin family)